MLGHVGPSLSATAGGTPLRLKLPDVNKADLLPFEAAAKPGGQTWVGGTQNPS